MTGALLNKCFRFRLLLAFANGAKKGSGREVCPAFPSISASPGATVLDGQAIRSCCVSPPNQTLSLISLPSALCMQAFIKGARQWSVLLTLCCFWSGSGALPTARQLGAWLLQSDSINKQLNWRCCLEAARREEAGGGFSCPQDVDVQQRKSSGGTSVYHSHLKFVS